MVATSSSVLPHNLSLYRYRRKNKCYVEELGDGVTLTLMLIPAGEFLMGAGDEPESYDRERPQHRVTVTQFLMGRFAVTQAQWRVVAGYERIDRDLDPDPSEFKGDNRPVENVSWEDAQEFCQRLSAKTGKDYRLPSEAQWEYACRAGTTTPFHFGEIITTEVVNYDENYSYKESPKGEYRGETTAVFNFPANAYFYENYSYKYSYKESPKGEYRGETTDVGSFPANDWGLHDMHGNVWEWCEDDWHGNYYNGAPEDGSAWLIENDNRSQTRKLLRGGFWSGNPQDCRSPCRSFDSRDDRGNDLGFRVCCVPPRILLSA